VLKGAQETRKGGLLNASASPTRNAPRALALCNLPPAGEVAGARIAELFASAASERFTGSLTIEPTHGAKVVFRIETGNITRWQSLDDHQFILESLAESLPPEQIEFVRRHAYESNLDEFGAAARLGLLTDRALEWIHRAATLRLLRVLSEPRFRHRYVFEAERDHFQGHDGYAHEVSALWILSECLLHAENLSWCRERLQALGDAPIRLAATAEGALTPLIGKARRVVQILRAGAESLETLRKTEDLPEPVVIGTIYALLATGAAELVYESVTVPRPTESLAPPRDEVPGSEGQGSDSNPHRFQVRSPDEWIRSGGYRGQPSQENLAFDLRRPSGSSTKKLPRVGIVRSHAQPPASRLSPRIVQRPTHRFAAARRPGKIGVRTQFDRTQFDRIRFDRAQFDRAQFDRIRFVRSRRTPGRRTLTRFGRSRRVRARRPVDGLVPSQRTQRRGGAGRRGIPRVPREL
jgi:hypothetical protein